MSELEQLKSQLRSLVVSSPTAVDARALLRDYRTLVGSPLPALRHGYRDPVQFLRERCADCFLFRGPPANPVLTLIVPDQLKHIDDFVQRQKMPSTKNFRVKRRSIPERRAQRSTHLIANTYVPPARQNIIKEETHNNVQPPPQRQSPERVVVKEKAESVANSESPKDEKNSADVTVTQTMKNGSGLAARETQEGAGQEGAGQEGAGKEGAGQERQRVLHRFLEKRLPPQQPRQRTASADSCNDDDSGRLTPSTGSSGGKQAALERLREEINQLVSERPGGVWVSQLMRIYQERFGRELNYSRLGFASISACAAALAGAAARAPGGDWLLTEPGAAPAAPRAPLVRRLPRPPAAAPVRPVDPDDALPGIEYDPDVFPADCLSFVESIPAASVADLAPGDMFELLVGEVYSPSHLWLLRQGPAYDKMEEIMDEMTEYFTKGEGVTRVLAAGARRPGQYCSSVYDGDWHRSLIVQLVDPDTVKVLHVDYGTVDTVAASSLRPLKRCWATLPAQAVRARLAGLRPPAAGRRWPRAAAQHLLRLVRDRRLVGNVLCVDHEEGVVELLLIDTSTNEDVNLTDEMVRAGHADPRRSAALGASEAYLFPLFSALESGATPNYAEIHALLRDGITLDYVDAYRRHVPPLLPPDHDACLPDAPHYTPPRDIPTYTPTRLQEPLVCTPPLDSPSSDSPSPQTSIPKSTSVSESDSPPSSPLAAPLRNRVPLIWVAASEPDLTVPPQTEAEKSTAIPDLKTTKSMAAIASPVTKSTQMVSACSQTALEVSTVTVVPELSEMTQPETIQSPARGAPAVPVATAVTQTTPVSLVEPLRPLQPMNTPRHPPAFYAVPPGYCPPSFQTAPQFAQYPRFVHPPGFYQAPRSARLTADECEVFELLSLVDKNAAHRYVSQALRRSLAAPAPAHLPPPPTRLDPLAPEFHALRPPPGFDRAAPPCFHPPPRR